MEERARRTLEESEYKRLRPIVRRTVMRLSAEVEHVGYDELAAWAWEGVLEAFERARGDLDPEEALAYATYRAQGAMLDALADRCPKARTARAASDRLAAIIRDLEARLGSPPHEDAIILALGVTREDYAELLDGLADSGVVRLEVVMAAPSFGAVVRQTGSRASTRPDVRTALEDAVAALPELQRALFALHLDEGLSLDAAALELGIEPRRARRLHVEAIHRLRARLTSAPSSSAAPSPRAQGAGPG